MQKRQILNAVTLSLAVAGFASGAFADHHKGQKGAACKGDCAKDKHKDCDCEKKGIKCNCKHDKKAGDKHEDHAEEKKADEAHH